MTPIPPRITTLTNADIIIINNKFLQFFLPNFFIV